MVNLIRLRICPLIEGGGIPARYNHAATNFMNDQIVIFGGKT
jgi:hypothetical protein